MNTNLPPTGWYLDPAGLADGRYWDGAIWTAAVTRTGVTATVPLDPTHAAMPPLPGTADSASVPTCRRPHPLNDRSAVAVGIGVMVAALVVLLLIAIVSNNGSDDAPSDVTEPPATAPLQPVPSATG